MAQTSVEEEMQQLQQQPQQQPQRGTNDDSDYDGKILAQERLLEKEVQESAPLVGSKTDFGSLAQEYAADAVYLKKIAVFLFEFRCMS